MIRNTPKTASDPDLEKTTTRRHRASCGTDGCFAKISFAAIFTAIFIMVVKGVVGTL